MKRSYILLLHLLVWLLLITSDALTNYLQHPLVTADDQPFQGLLLGKYLLIAIGFNGVAAANFYGAYKWLGPPLFLHKHYLKAFLFAVLVLGGMVALRYAIEYGFFLPVLGWDNYYGKRWSAGHYIQNAVFFYLPRYFTYGLIYYVWEQWQQNNKRRQELQQEKLAAELAFLRSQVNPHFIFNTINDIYALTYHQSEQAPGALLKLSELLRYMLREGQQDFVTLTEEVTYLHNVIELHCIGAKGEAFVEFKTRGITPAHKIASLLLIAFVENAFKHGVWNDSQHPVHIHLEANTSSISFTVQNKISHYRKDATKGIGLRNVKRRLELIYPAKHRLEIGEEADIYGVHLIIEQNLPIAK